MAYTYDPELAPFVPLLTVDMSAADIAEVRATSAERFTVDNGTVDVTGVEVTDHAVPGPAGAPGVTVRVYRPSGSTAPVPGVLSIHGGGFIVGSIDMDHPFASRVVRELGAAVASVEYRLAPEHPFPAGLEDCYAALAWLHRQSGELGIDPGNIAIYGQSAGGGLAAGLALLARDRGGPPISFQFLGIPELDDRLDTPSMRAFVDTPLWNRPSAVRSWQSYLGAAHDGDVPLYAAPARATAADLAGLPPAYVCTMEYDPLRDEGIHYALRLLEAGVPVELHSFPGTFHGCGLIGETVGVNRRIATEQLGALRRGLRLGD